jgi:hypothetical protein
MTQIQAGQIRRRGGDINVYTGLLFVATAVLAVGVAILFMNNSTHSESDGAQGGPFQVLGDPGR